MAFRSRACRAVLNAPNPDPHMAFISTVSGIGMSCHPHVDLNQDHSSTDVFRQQCSRALAQLVCKMCPCVTSLHPLLTLTQPSTLVRQDCHPDVAGAIPEFLLGRVHAAFPACVGGLDAAAARGLAAATSAPRAFIWTLARCISEPISPLNLNLFWSCAGSL